MLVVDSHLDLAMNAVYLNRDLTMSIAEIRASEQGIDRKGFGNNTVSFPELRRTEIAVTFCTVIARHEVGTAEHDRLSHPGNCLCARAGPARLLPSA